MLTKQTFAQHIQEDELIWKKIQVDGELFFLEKGKMIKIYDSPNSDSIVRIRMDGADSDYWTIFTVKYE